MKGITKWLLLVIFIAHFPLLAQSEDPFQWEFDGSSRRVGPGEALRLEITFRIPPRHFLYKEKFELSLKEGEGFELGPLEFSPAIKKKDPFFEKEMEVFEAGALLKATVRATPNAPLGERVVRLELAYQGCSDSLCYRLMRREVALPVEIVASPSLRQNRTREMVDTFRNRSLWFLLLLAFLAGVGSDFTPCVLPIIPITLAFIGVRKGEKSTRRNFFLTLVFVFSMAATYAAMGVAATLLGKSLGFLFQNVFFLIFASLLYLLLALSLLGFFELQIPLGIRNRIARWGGEGIWGSMLSGLTIGFLAAPCIGPVIASLLLYVAQERDLVKGFTLLLSYGLGMGSLFLIIGTFYHRFAQKVRGGAYTVWIKRVFALLLLVPTFYYGRLAATQLVQSKAPRITSEVFWIQDLETGFSRAAAEQKPIFVDFYAAWCLPCVDMENRTFSNDDLQALLLERFVPIKVDCTQETPQCREMVEKYSVVGWPTFLILTAEGEVVESIVGKSLSSSQLMEILEKTLMSYSDGTKN